MDISTLLNVGSLIVLLAGAFAVFRATYNTNMTRLYKESAEAHKDRADRAFEKIEEMTKEIAELKQYTHSLVSILTTIDPARLEELRLRRGL